jgi:cysteine desulfuration protein SufE
MTGPNEPSRGSSLAAVQEEIVAEMAGLDGMIQKYEYLVARGRALEVRDGSLRREEHVVPGCQSRVWIRSELRGGVLHIEADSDAMITRGIIALLLRVLHRRTPSEILDGELFFLDRTGLAPHLSPTRANGLAALVREIRRHAEEASGRS